MSTPSELWALGGTPRPAAFANWGTKVSSDVDNANARLKEITEYELNVKDFGAAGDGITDDTAAVVAVLAQAAAVGVGVVVPQGIFNIHDVSVPAGARIRGMKGAVVRRTSGGSTGRVFHVQGADVHISDLVIDGNPEVGTPAGGGVIDIRKDNCTIDNVTITSSPGKGIRVVGDLATKVGVSGTRILNCTIRDTLGECVGLTGEGDYVGFEVSNCVLDRSAMAPETGRVLGTTNNTSWVSMVTGVRFVNNTVYSTPNSDFSAQCIEILGATHTSDIVVAGNICYDGSMGISVGEVSNITIANNVCFQPGGYGFEVNTFIGFAITGNIVFGHPTVPGPGITLNSSIDGAVTGNVLRGCSHGIVTSNVAATPSTVAIAGNTIIDAVNEGIKVSNAAEGYAVTGNLVDSCGADGIRYDNAFDVTCTGNRVKGCPVGLNVRGATAGVFAGTIVGNNLLGNTIPYQESMSGGATIGQLHRWANAGVLPVVSGSRGDNAALADLLTKLSSQGVITDSTS